MAGGGKGGQQQQQTQTVDPATQAFQNDFLRPLSRDAAKVALTSPGSFFGGPTETFTGAVEGLQGLTGQIGNVLGGLDERISGALGSAPGLGFSAQAFDPTQIDDFRNQFAQQAINPAFDRRRTLDQNAASDLETSAFALGGTRGQILQNEAADAAERARFQALFQTEDAAMGRGFQAHAANQQNALQAAIANQQAKVASRGQNLQGVLGGTGLGLQGIGLGANAFGQLAGLGDLERQIGDQQRQEGLFRHGTALGFGQQGLGGPFGTTATMTGGGTNPLASAAGGALTGFGVGGPIGGAIGGGVGLLGGLLGF